MASIKQTDTFGNSEMRSYSLWPHGSWLFFFSTVANLLMLAMPLYLAQIYDRVLPTNSFETLLYLAILMACALMVFGAMESLRSRIAQRMSADFELQVAPVIAGRAIVNINDRAMEPGQRIADIASLRQLISSRAFIGLFDLPFAPVFLLLLFLVHPVLGGIAVAGAILLLLIAFANEKMTTVPQEHARHAQAIAGRQISDMLKRMDDVRALGLAKALFRRWEDAALDAAGEADRMAKTNAHFFGLVRFSRQMLQVMLLGIGAYLVMQGSMSAGLIFAASIISGKALQPIEHVIGSWRQLAAGREAWKRVSTELARSQEQVRETVRLHDMAGYIDVDDLFYTANGTIEERPLLAEVSFSANPGEITAFIGSSGAGKSTLLRLVAGIHAAVQGTVRYDGFETNQWDIDQFGSSIGYLGQDIDFFSGTIAENIARFADDASDEEVIAAAERAGAHAFIGTLEEGYMTRIGPGGIRLSGGQKQRIALARAFYRDPAVLLLDEPDASLDSSGSMALKEALVAAKARNKTIIVVTHRKPLLDICDHILLLKNGQVAAFGPKDTVLAPGGQRAPAARRTLSAVQ